MIGKMRIRVHSPKRICQIVTRCFMVAIAFCFLSGTYFAQGQTLTATITDFMGKEITVTNLRACYERPAEEKTIYGPGDASPTTIYTPGATRQRPQLVIELALKENNTVWEETIRIMLINLRLISFEPRSVTPFYPPEKILLEKRDGSRILMDRSEKGIKDYDIFEERDSRGEVRKVIKPGFGKVTVTCKLKDRNLRMTGFEGLVKMSNGEEDKFYIELREVRSIVIK